MSKKQAIKVISFLWIGSLLGAGCAFLTQVILARQLGPATYGKFSAALATIAMLAPIAGFGIAQYWLKVFGEEGWAAKRWFVASFHYIALSTMLVILTLLVWSLFGPHDKFMRNILWILSLYVIGQVALELVGSKLQLEERYTVFTLWQFFPHLVRLVLVVILVYLLNDWVTIYGAALVYAVTALILAAFGGFQLVRMATGYFNLKGHSTIERITTAFPSIKDVVFQSWPFGLAGFFHFIYFQSDIILIKYIVNDEAAGIYNVAFTIMGAVYLLPNVVFQRFLLPKMHRWANHNREMFYQVYRQGNVAMMGLGTGAMLVIWASASWIIPFLFSDSYSDAIILLNILAVCAPVVFLATSIGATLVTQDHMKRKVKYMGIVAVLNILLNIALIPTFGAVGAALATVISLIVLLIIYFMATRTYVFDSLSKTFF